MHSNINHHRIFPIRLVIPDLIRNPVFEILVSCSCRDDVWIPAFAGMTGSDMYKAGVKP